MDIEEDLKRQQYLNEEDNEPPRLSWPIKVIFSLFLLLIIVTWTFSYYAGEIDPEPRIIPTKDEVVPLGLSFSNASFTISSKDDYYNFILSDDEEIKKIADRIATRSCEGSRICQAKAMYYFVRDNYDYVSDPLNSEYVEDPKEFLSIGSGDCESGTIALASLLRSIGIYTELVFIPRHAYLRIKLPEASKRYQKDGWVYLDWTCDGCAFGDIP